MFKFNSETKILSKKETAPIYNPNVSLGHVILHHLNKYPENIFQVCADDGLEQTCGEIAKLSENFAKNMLKRGFIEGDVVGIVGRNIAETVPVIFGCLIVGLPFSPVHPQSEDFKIVFDVTQPKIIFCDHDIAEKVREKFGTKGKQIKIVSLTEKIEGFGYVSEYFEDELEVTIPLLMKSKASETVAAMMWTSGTTTPAVKIAKVSHAQFNDVRALYGVSKEVFGFIFAGFSWITGLGLLIFTALNHEKRLFTKMNFSPDAFFDLLEKYKFSHMTGTPPMYQALQLSPRFATADFSCIQKFFIGGTHCSLEMRKSILEKMPNTKLVIVYGMTENLTNCVTDEENPLSLSVGKPFSDTQVKILVSDGSLGNLNEIGEILLKRPRAPFLGYVNNETYTKAALDEDNWLHTGDMGFIDDELNLNIVGRKSFVILRGSKLIFPTEIEEIIEKLPGVQSVCVVGVKPKNSDEELPTAFVVKDKGSDVTEKNIHDAVKHLEDHKQLSGGVFFIDSFPRMTSGKILLYRMKEMGQEMMKIQFHS